MSLCNAEAEHYQPQKWASKYENQSDNIQVKQVQWEKLLMVQNSDHSTIALFQS